MLNDRQILGAIERRKIGITPFSRMNLGPNSYDLTLDDRFAEYSHTLGPSFYSGPRTYDVTKQIPPYFQFGPKGDNTLSIRPHSFAVVISREIVHILPPYIGIISPRSSFACLPFSISYSQLVDTGFKGVIKVSLFNVSNDTIILHKGQRFFQMMVHFTKNDFLKTYEKRSTSKYMFSGNGEVPIYKIDKEWLDGNL